LTNAGSLSSEAVGAAAVAVTATYEQAIASKHTKSMALMVFIF